MKKLFCPGPVNVSVDIAELAMNTNIGHRSEEFEEIFRNIKYMTLRMYGADENKYICLPITGSATLANEMCISSALNQKDRVLLLTNGVFGDRLKHILNVYHISFTEYREPAGFDVKKVQKLVDDNDFTWILMVHHETSTGILNPIENISQIAQRNNIRFMADAVSSASADKIDLSDTYIDIIVTTSGKAIGAYPGIGLICVARDVYENVLTKKAASDYLDLFKNIEFSENNSQSLHTPSTPLFIALDAQMHKILVNPSYNHDRYKKMNDYIRREMKLLGVQPYLGDNVRRSVTLSSFLLDPKVFNIDAFIENMNDRGYVLYIGKGELHDIGLFQIANMGDLRMTDCYALVDSIRKELETGDSRWN